MPNPESITLVPFLHLETGFTASLGVTLEENEFATLGIEGLGVVISSVPSSRAFKVTKLPAETETREAMEPIAEDWNLQRESVVIRAQTSVEGLLLGPSIIGGHLYGGELPDSEMLRSKFGYIRTMYDESESRWALHIIMPDEPYRQLSRVSFAE